jgi:hypothetical protein
VRQALTRTVGGVAPQRVRRRLQAARSKKWCASKCDAGPKLCDAPDRFYQFCSGWHMSIAHVYEDRFCSTSTVPALVDCRYPTQQRPNRKPACMKANRRDWPEPEIGVAGANWIVLGDKQKKCDKLTSYVRI